MNILRALHELQPCNRSVAVAIGFFDGVHLGHRQILGTTVAAARETGGLPVAITFSRHPSWIVAPDRVPPLIQPLDARLRGIVETGIEKVVLLDFDERLSQSSGEDFIRSVARYAGHLRLVCVGERFRFGKDRLGDVPLLKRLGHELGYRLAALRSVEVDGQPVSSTRIRTAIGAGELASASRMLSRPYSISGKVVEGDRLGRKLNFPTANLDASGLVLPPFGVYLAKCKTRSGAWWSVVNVGVRPTVATAPERRVEAYLLDFEGDLYGEQLELVIDKKLRSEMRFPDVDALRRQIALDVASARECLAGVRSVGA